MSWPNTSEIVTTSLDAGTDSPATARSDLKNALDAVTEIINARDAADGIAGLDSESRIAFDQLQSETGSSFPTATSLDYGYRVFRTDLGEWFTLMDATVWGGSGKAWVSDLATWWGFGQNMTNPTPQNKALGTIGNSNPTSTNCGLLLDADYLITSCNALSVQDNTATVDVRDDGVIALSLTLTSEKSKTLAAGAANWERMSSGSIMHVDWNYSAGTLQDPTVWGILRKVIDA